MTTTAPDTLSVRAAERQDRIAGRVSTLRTRGASGDLDRWLLIIGGVLVPLGILLVVLGWLGASRTPLVFEQIPYMISGGLLGLALTFAGGFVYFAYWETVRVRDARAQSKDVLDALGRIEHLLASGAAGIAAGAVSAYADGGINGHGATSDVGPLVSTETGTMIHRPDCPIVTGRDNLRAVTPDTPGLRPCRICEPLAVSEQST